MSDIGTLGARLPPRYQFRCVTVIPGQGFPPLAVACCIYSLGEGLLELLKYILFLCAPFKQRSRSLKASSDSFPLLPVS